MAFTYGGDLVNTPRDRVRWESSDTGEKDEAGNVVGWFNDDTELDSLLALNENSYQAASLAAIRGIIGKLSRPTFQADWLRVDNKVAIESYRKLLAEKQEEYGVTLSGAWFETGQTDVKRSDVPEEGWMPRYPDNGYPYD
ncbi:MAG: hypothetical protein AAFN11_09865 [Chloroflexota bacterium]